MQDSIYPRVGISGTTAKSRKRKFVPSSHPGPFAVVWLFRDDATTVKGPCCFNLLKYKNCSARMEAF